MKLAKHQIARQFSRAAKTYDEVAQIQATMASRLLKRIPNDAIGTLVDLGCGTGSVLSQLEDTTLLKLIGVDLSAAMLEVASSRTQQVKLIESDLEQSGLADDGVEFVFSNAAIQWCNAEAALAEMARVLKPTGTLLVSTFGPATLREWKTAWQAIGDPYQRVHEFESVENLRLAVAKAGLKDVQMFAEIETMEFDDIDSMFHSIKKLGATNAAPDRPTGMLGRQTYRKLRDHFTQQLVRDQTLTLSFECIYIVRA